MDPTFSLLHCVLCVEMINNFTFESVFCISSSVGQWSMCKAGSLNTTCPTFSPGQVSWVSSLCHPNPQLAQPSLPCHSLMTPENSHWGQWLEMCAKVGFWIAGVLEWLRWIGVTLQPHTEYVVWVSNKILNRNFKTVYYSAVTWPTTTGTDITHWVGVAALKPGGCGFVLLVLVGRKVLLQSG